MDAKFYIRLLIHLIVLIGPSFGQLSNNPGSGQGDFSYSSGANELYKIEGKVFPKDGLTPTNLFLVQTKVIVNYGQFYGFLKSDGSFEISNLTPGSYVVEISNPNYFYEPIRVDINSKGKMRARKINYIQVTEVKQLTYPLRFKVKTPFKYFQVRESWKVTDFIFNPMVLMMVLPLFFIMVLPKMMNPNEMELQKPKELQNMPKYELSEMPELSEMVTNWFGNKPATAKSIKSNKKKQ